MQRRPRWVIDGCCVGERTGNVVFCGKLFFQARRIDGDERKNLSLGLSYDCTMVPSLTSRRACVRTTYFRSKCSHTRTGGPSCCLSAAIVYVVVVLQHSRFNLWSCNNKKRLCMYVCWSLDGWSRCVCVCVDEEGCVCVCGAVVLTDRPTDRTSEWLWVAALGRKCAKKNWCMDGGILYN